MDSTRDYGAGDAYQCMGCGSIIAAAALGPEGIRTCACGAFHWVSPPYRRERPWQKITGDQQRLFVTFDPKT